MKWFRNLYVWAMNVKLFMALYFIVMVFVLGVITLFLGGDSIRLLTLLEMLLVCAVIGFLQALLLDDSTDYTRGVFFGRSLIWLVGSTALAVAAALIFGWFGGYPAWSLIAFAGFMLFALTLTLVGLKFEQEADTVRLNEDLNRFKHKA